VTLPVQPIHSQLKHSAPPFKPASQMVVSPTTVQVCVGVVLFLNNQRTCNSVLSMLSGDQHSLNFINTGFAARQKMHARIYDKNVVCSMVLMLSMINKMLVQLLLVFFTYIHFFTFYVALSEILQRNSE